MQIGNVQIPKFLDYEKETLTPLMASSSPSRSSGVMDNRSGIPCADPAFFHHRSRRDFREIRGRFP